jgi:hypothetical protein
MNASRSRLVALGVVTLVAVGVALCYNNYANNKGKIRGKKSRKEDKRSPKKKKKKKTRDGDGESPSKMESPIKKKDMLAALVKLMAVGTQREKELAAGGTLEFAHEDKRNIKRVLHEDGMLAAIVSILRDHSPENKESRERAAAILSTCCVNADNRSIVGQVEGCIAALVVMVRSGCQEAAICLYNLSIQHTVNKTMVGKEEGCVEALLTMLRDGNASAREHAAGALMCLSTLPLHQISMASVDGIFEILISRMQDDIIAGGDCTVKGKEKALVCFLHLSIPPENKVRMAAMSGCLPTLVALMRGGDDNSDGSDGDGGSNLLRERAAAAVSSLANDKTNQVTIANEHQQVVPALISLLRRWEEGSDLVREEALSALFNLTCNPQTGLATQVRIVHGKEGGVAALVAILRYAGSSSRCMEHAVGTLMSLAYHADNRTVIGDDESDCIGALVALLKDNGGGGGQQNTGNISLKCIEKAAGCLNNLCFENKNMARVMATAGGVQALVALLRGDGEDAISNSSSPSRSGRRSSSRRRKQNAAAVLLNLSRGGDDNQRVIIDAGGLAAAEAQCSSSISSSGSGKEEQGGHVAALVHALRGHSTSLIASGGEGESMVLTLQ